VKRWYVTYNGQPLVGEYETFEGAERAAYELFANAGFQRSLLEVHEVTRRLKCRAGTVDWV
jgi:hypothetical protein